MTTIYETQKKQVRKFLEEGKAITQQMAISLCSCYRLSAVIFRLKHDDGLDIRSRWTIDINSQGATIRYKYYYLAEFEEKYKNIGQ